MELDLQEIRLRLDAIDAELSALREKRRETVTLVAAYKKERGMPILDAAREEKILEKVRERVGQEIAPYAAEVYRKILEMSRAYQAARLEEKP